MEKNKSREIFMTGKDKGGALAGKMTDKGKVDAIEAIKKARAFAVITVEDDTNGKFVGVMENGDVIRLVQAVEDAVSELKEKAIVASLSGLTGMPIEKVKELLGRIKKS